MNITFFTNKSPNLTLIPNLTQYGNPITITPYGALSVVNPIIILDYDVNIEMCNYCKIVWDNNEIMWYHCTFALDNGGRMIANCNRDPLYTFANQIKNCPVTVVRNGGIGAPTIIPDNKLPIKLSEEKIDQVPVSNPEFKPLLTYPYVIQVIGG